MTCEPMPFMTGPVLADPGLVSHHEPRGDLSSVIPLSKTQQALWLDHLRRPCASHYHLRLQVDLSGYNPSLEQLIQVIQLIGRQHAMLRTTFHVDADNEISNSFMAVHPQDSSVQSFEIVNDEGKLNDSLRRGFNLSLEYAVRWVIHHRIASQAGKIQNSYKLFVVGHHIAVDGSSLSFLSKQLLEHLDPALEAADVGEYPSCGEYVQRETAFLKSTNGEAAKQFWLSQVSNTVPFSWSIQNPAKRSSDYYRQMHTWVFFSNEELQLWSKLYKTSWFRIATTIISLVTAGNAKATPHHDHALLVAFGARPKDFQTCVSHMANTMPVKAPLSSLLQSNATFSEAVQGFGKNMSNAKKHEMFPFLSLVEEARKTMDESQLDFKVAVTFSPKLASKACKIYPVEGVWDLFFCFLEHDDGVSLGVIADPQIIDPAGMAKLQTQFVSTVKMSQQGGSFRLSELEYLRDREIASLVHGPAINDLEAVNHSRVHLWIKDRAAKQPDANALYSAERGEAMTYRDLARKSSQIAHFLQKMSLKAGDSVLLHFSRGFNTVLWILGVLEAGACYVVLDKALPTDRKHAIAKASEGILLVTDDFRAQQFIQDLEITVLTLEVITADLSQQPSTTLPSAVADDDLAYIVYTSGSTGKPKGVMVEHSNLSHYVSAARSVVKIGPASRVLQFATFAFDASVLEWAVSLSYGATLCFVDHPELLVGDYLADVIDRNEINFFHTTPSVLATIGTERRLPSLRMLSVGGEASSAGLLARWRQKLQLLHAYGPTETTVIVTVETIDEDQSSEASLPSPSVIGKPFPGSRILIRGEDDERVLPPGEPGEICIAGPQVSRGYKGDQELTNTMFRTIQYEGRDTRLYRTGDRGFIDHDGKLSICGRMKNREIKLRGYRMDLYEIEKSILDHSPEVQVVSVQVQGDSLVALIVPGTAPCDVIRKRLAQDVPSYSVPARFIALSNLPLNVNGKVDHARVAEKLQDLVSSSQETPGSKRRDSKMDETSNVGASHPQADALKGVLAELWMHTLGLVTPPKPGVSFFDAGGHSILLTELHKRIMSRFPTCNMSLLDIFQAPSVERQAEYIMKHVGGSLLCSDKDSSSSSCSGRGTDATSINDPPSNDDNKFAIVGLAGYFPGATNVDEFWEMLMDRRDAITTHGVTTKPSDLTEEEVFVPRYGSLPSTTAFNSNDWNMTAEEAALMDPQKLLFLNVAAQALTDANTASDPAHPNPIGIFVGAAPNTYKDSPSAPAPADPFQARHRTLLDPPISTFTAYKLNLTGPSLTLNTACSSSLVALHAATNALKARDCATALVGGVSIAFPQAGGYATAPGQVFSPSGRCTPLDARADGAVPSDAVAAVVLKPLAAARSAGDAVYAVVEGGAVGTDGAVGKAGFTVPSSAGQARTVAAAVRDAGMAPEAVRYVELHGSGTSMGDALEVQGLERGLEEVGHMGVVHVGSNKGAFGNAEAAGGLLSLIKMALAVSKGVVPPLRELEKANSMCNFQGRLRPLLSPMKLADADRVGVTSIGYGGTNAHVVLTSASAYGATSRER